MSYDFYRRYEIQLHHICCESYISSGLGAPSILMPEYIIGALEGHKNFDPITKLLKDSVEFYREMVSVDLQDIEEPVISKPKTLKVVHKKKIQGKIPQVIVEPEEPEEKVPQNKTSESKKPTIIKKNTCQCILSGGPNKGEQCGNVKKYPENSPEFCGHHKVCRLPVSSLDEEKEVSDTKPQKTPKLKTKAKTSEKPKAKTSEKPKAKNNGDNPDVVRPDKCQCILASGPNKGKQCTGTKKYPENKPKFCHYHKQCRKVHL